MPLTANRTAPIDMPPPPGDSSRPLHVVIVDEELPYPPNSGKRIRSLNLTLHAAKQHKITYLCHRNADSAEAQEASCFFESHGIETVLVDRAVPPKRGLTFYARLAWNLGSPLPYSVQVHASRQLRRAIRRYAASNSVDLWHCEWTPYAQSVAGVVQSPWVVMAHNIESLIWQRYYETEQNPLKRWYIRQQWRKFERFERTVFGKADRSIVVSEEDGQLARLRFNAPRVAVVENGVDTAYFQPNETAREPNRLLFLGSLDWRPNLDAICFFLDEVFGRLLAEEPSARLSIVGRKPPEWLAARVSNSTNVELHADVPDVRPFLHRAGMLVVPLRIGGGSRLKILEALSAGCPVVSTNVGAEGLELDPNRHFLLADEPDQMVRVLAQAIRNPAEAAETAQLGRQMVLENSDWHVLSKKLDRIWRDATHNTSTSDRADQYNLAECCPVR